LQRLSQISGGISDDDQNFFAQLKQLKKNIGIQVSKRPGKKNSRSWLSLEMCRPLPTPLALLDRRLRALPQSQGG
jgi:hypothetical protein